MEKVSGSGQVIPFDWAVERMYYQGKVDFHRLIRIEMMAMGYNPNDQDDLTEFWKLIYEEFIEDDDDLTTPKQPDW